MDTKAWAAAQQTAAVNRLTTAIKKDGVPLTNIADETGIPYATLHRWLEGDKPMTLRGYLAVAYALGIEQPFDRTAA